MKQIDIELSLMDVTEGDAMWLAEFIEEQLNEEEGITCASFSYSIHVSYEPEKTDEENN